MFQINFVSQPALDSDSEPLLDIDINVDISSRSSPDDKLPEDNPLSSCSIPGELHKEKEDTKEVRSDFH